MPNFTEDTLYWMYSTVSLCSIYIKWPSYITVFTFIGQLLELKQIIVLEWCLTLLIYWYTNIRKPVLPNLTYLSKWKTTYCLLCKRRWSLSVFLPFILMETTTPSVSFEKTYICRYFPWGTRRIELELLSYLMYTVWINTHYPELWTLVSGGH